MVGRTDIAQCSGSPGLTFDLLGQLGFPRRKLLLMLISVFPLPPPPFWKTACQPWSRGHLRDWGDLGRT